MANPGKQFSVEKKITLRWNMDMDEYLEWVGLKEGDLNSIGLEIIKAPPQDMTISGWIVRPIKKPIPAMHRKSDQAGMDKRI